MGTWGKATTILLIWKHIKTNIKRDKNKSKKGKLQYHKKNNNQSDNDKTKK